MSAGPPCKKLKQAQLTLFVKKPEVSVTNDDDAIVEHRASSIDKASDVLDSLTPAAGLATADVHVILHPNQPMNKTFPSKEYSGKSRRFQATFFTKYKWLHWDESVQSVYCQPCHNIRLLGLKLLVSDRSGDNAFSTTGYQSWRTPTLDFQKHEQSEKHKECVAKWLHHIRGTNVDAQLFAAKSREQTTNQHALMKILRTTAVIGRQGLSLRGHTEEEGNFMQFLHLVAEDNVSLNSYLASAQRRKFLSHDNQNEMLSMLSHHFFLF